MARCTELPARYSVLTSTVRPRPCAPCPRSYAPGDPIESWLHGVLCLDAATQLPKPPPRLPHPSQCELYYVERDTLFSYHKVRLWWDVNSPALRLLTGSASHFPAACG